MTLKRISGLNSIEKPRGIKNNMRMKEKERKEKTHGRVTKSRH